MYDLSIEYQIDEFMIYCRSRELRAKTLESYEHTLRLFERWCNDELNTALCLLRINQLVFLSYLFYL